MDTDMAALLLLYFSLAVVQAGPRVWGERATRRDLLSPCPVQASMIAHFTRDHEDLAGALPASSSRGRWLSSSARPPVFASPESCSPLAEEALFSSVAQQEVKVEVKYHL